MTTSKIGIGYLYVIEDGFLNEYRGELCEVNNHYVWFAEVRTDRGKRKTCRCSLKEGVVNNQVVWFKESNKLKAAEAFIEYKEKRILVYQEQTTRSRKAIDMLKELIKKGNEED